MSQPVDFIGLNTFIYEPSGWFPPDQQPSAFDDRHDKKYPSLSKY